MATEQDMVPSAVFIAPSGRMCLWKPKPGHVVQSQSHTFVYADRKQGRADHSGAASYCRRESFVLTVANLRLLRRVG